jgi:hypothetical protein
LCGGDAVAAAETRVLVSAAAGGARAAAAGGGIGRGIGGLGGGSGGGESGGRRHLDWYDDGPHPEERAAQQKAIVKSFESLKKLQDDAHAREEGNDQRWHRRTG